MQKYEKPLVSIVVPSFNNAEFLPRCLDSLIGQTMHDIEIICVDDCSEDSSVEILHHYADKDHRVIVYCLETKGGAGGGLNTGIRMARADFIALVDSDDFVDIEMIQALYDAITSASADMAISDYYRYTDDNHKYFEENIPSEICNLPRNQRNSYFILHGGRLFTNLFRKSLFFDNNLFYPENSAFEDLAIGQPLYCCCNKCVKVSRPLYFYRVSNSISQTRSPSPRFFKRLDTTRLYLENMKRLGFWDSHKEETEFRFIQIHYLNTLHGYIRIFPKIEKKWLATIRSSIMETLPNFRNNPYFRKRKAPFIYRIVEHASWISPSITIGLVKISRCIPISCTFGILHNWFRRHKTSIKVI